MYNLINVMNAYKLDHEGDLFDNITLYDKINKDITINTILDEAGILEPVTSNPDLLKLKINNFFGRNYTNFKHLMDAFLLEYEPIENYDRHSEITLTDSGTITDAGGGSNTRTPDLTNTETVDTSNTRTANLSNKKTGTDSDNETRDLTTTPNTTHETQVSAFNSSDYQPKEKIIDTGNQKDTGTDNHTMTYNTTATETGTDTMKNAGTTTTAQTGSEVTKVENNNTQTTDMRHKTIDHTHGNIGVTTSQQMLQSEIDLWTKFNVYKCIADMFVNDLMLTVID